MYGCLYKCMFVPAIAKKYVLLFFFLMDIYGMFVLATVNKYILFFPLLFMDINTNVCLFLRLQISMSFFLLFFFPFLLFC